MKRILLVAFSAFALTACGGVDVPEIGDVPQPDLDNIPSADELMNDINAQIEADLADAGIDVDMDELNEDAANEAELDEMMKVVGDGVMNLEMKEGSVSELWPEVKKFAEGEYPGATLVAYNSYDATGYNDLFLPERSFTDGKSGVWYFFFALDGALEDEEVYASEVVAVEFMDGRLQFVPGDYGVFTDAGGDQLFGDELIEVTAGIAAVATAKVEAEPRNERPVVHLDFECKPVQTAFADGNGYCTVYGFEEGEKAVYEIGIIPKTGEVYSFEYSELVEFSV